MKLCLRYRPKYFARFIGSLVPWQLSQYYNRLKYNIHSGIYTKAFKSCGKEFYLESPALLLGSKYITIGNNFSSHKRLRMEAHDSYNTQSFTPKIIIGNNVALNYNCHIACINEVIIGNFVLMGSNVLITDHFHGEINELALQKPPALRDLYSKGSVIIEDNVWIGDGVIIMPGVTIGANSIIGAGAIVTKSIPPYCVAAGNPASLIKVLKKDQ